MAKRSQPILLDTVARAGFELASNPHLKTSPNWYAHELGRYYRSNHWECPVDVRMSRGTRVRVGDKVWQHMIALDGMTVFERVK